MFGRNGGTKATVANAADSVRSAVSGAADPVVGYVDPLAKDEKLRRRLLAAVAAGAAARQRAQSQAGLRGLVSRLASDRVLHAQLAEVVTELQAAQKRARKVHSHKLRNTFFFLGGVSLAIALIATRDEWLTRIRERGETPGSGNSWSPAGPASSSSTTEDAEAPLATAAQQTNRGSGESSNTDD
jgi:hypothetical protein